MDKVPSILGTASAEAPWWKCAWYVVGPLKGLCGQRGASEGEREKMK